MSAAAWPVPGPPARPAGRAAQLTGRQPALDSIDICFYGDHSASEREQTFPGRSRAAHIVIAPSDRMSGAVVTATLTGTGIRGSQTLRVGDGAAI